MSGAGSPKLTIDAGGVRAVIIAASWHETVMNGLIAGAQGALKAAGCASIELIRVPGSFELPIVAQNYADRFDVVIALGVIIRGGTPHFEYVSAAATDGLARVALDTGVPIGFGLLTCDDEAQALDRAGLPGSSEDKGAEAALAALATWSVLRESGSPEVP